MKTETLVVNITAVGSPQEQKVYVVVWVILIFFGKFGALLWPGRHFVI